MRKFLPEKLLKKKTDPIKASREIYQILVDLEYPAELQGWFEIDEMIWDYEHFVKNRREVLFLSS